ncbi:MAG: TPM domain-containing protein [Myxococcota bacterium]
MKIEELFDEDAFRHVERAVQQAEQHTSGEIVPMLVLRSDTYAGARALAAAALAFTSGVGVLASGSEAGLWLPPVQALGFALGYWALGWGPLLRRWLPEAMLEAPVERAARLAFLEEGLIETRDRTGVLIYISLLERRVRVLADRGIDDVVEPGTWDGVVETILRGIRAGRAEAGLVEAIRICGELLQASFPRRADDTNELSNRLRIEPD